MTSNPNEASNVAKVDADFRQRLFADIDWIQDMFREGIEPDADALDVSLKRLRQAAALLVHPHPNEASMVAKALRDHSNDYPMRLDGKIANEWTASAMSLMRQAAALLDRRATDEGEADWYVMNTDGADFDWTFFTSIEEARSYASNYDEADRPEIIPLYRHPRSAAPVADEGEPVDMILHCPRCHTQHVDAPDERTPEWNNPPHRSHLCHACGCIWRPADVATNGVAAIKTQGSKDTPRSAAPERVPWQFEFQPIPNSAGPEEIQLKLVIGNQRFTINDPQDCMDDAAWLAEQLDFALRRTFPNDAAHVFWGAGEAGCPKEIKASNGEIHTLRCKNCGLDNPKGSCVSTPTPRDASSATSEAEKPIATLHDDGHWTWNGTEPYKSRFAGWRMEVFAHPAQQQRQPQGEL